MQNLQIKNPKNLDFDSIKKNIIQTAGCITTTLTYPNGFVITMVQTADEIKVSSNRPLIDNGDGTMSIPE